MMVREFLKSLWHGHWGQLRPSLGPKKSFFFYIQFSKNYVIFWDLGLTLCDIFKDVVFSKISGF